MSDDLTLESASLESDVLDTSAAGGLVIRGATFRVLGFIAGTALSVVSAVLLTRHLGVTRFGEYTTVISIVTVTAALTDLGITSLATREYAVRFGADREQLLRDVLGLRLAICAIAVLVAAAFTLAAGYDGERILGTVLAGIGLALASVQVTVAVPLSTMLRLGQTSALELMRQAFWVALLVTLVLLNARLLWLLAATIPASVLVLVTTAWLARNQMPFRPNLRPGAWVKLLRDTVAFSLATGVGAMYVFATQILTSLATNGRQNGLFAASFRVFIVAASTAGLIVSAAFPVLARAARDDHERLHYAVQRLFEVMLILGIAAALSAVAGAKPIIEVIAGPHYAGAVGPLRIEGAALGASFLLPVWGLALISLRRHLALVVANLIALGTTVTLTLILAGSYGATGAAEATVGGEWVIGTGLLLALVRGGSDSNLRLKPSILVKVAAAAAPAFCVLLLGLPQPIQLALALLVYGGGILIVKAVPRELYWALFPRRSRLM